MLRNTGVGTFWDVVLRVMHEGKETDQNVVRRIGPQSETGQIFLLVPARFCDKGTPGVGVRPRGRVKAEALLDGEMVAGVDLPSSAEPPQVERVPRSAEEEATLLQGRQAGWEYLLFVAVLLRELNALESKYRDHEVGFATPGPGPSLTTREVMGVLGEAIDEVLTMVGNVNRLFDLSTQERAFGAPGEPGDPDRIEHVASRVVTVYDALLDWAAHIRGLRVQDDFRPVANLVSHFVDAPIEQFRHFVARAVAEADRVPGLFADERRDEPIRVELILTLSVDEALMEQYQGELRRLRELYGLDE